MKRRLLSVFAFAALSAPFALPAHAQLIGQARVQPGDTLTVAVSGDPTLSRTVVVMDDGSVAYPVLGRVMVGNLTIPQVEASFYTRLQPYERHPAVTVAIAQTGLWNVTVLGNVKNPGKYQLQSGSRVADAIAAAGGVGPTNGPIPDGRVMDRAGNVETVSMQSLLRSGDPRADVALTNGATVYVPSPVTIDVSVLGAVDHAGDIQLNAGDRLSMAIAKAGASVAAKSDLNHVYLTRELTTGQKQTYDINLYQALQENDPRYDVQMQKGDVVYVAQERPGGGGLLWNGLLLLRRLVIGY